MKTIEQLNAEHAKALLVLNNEIAIANACPVPPNSVMSFSPNSWVSYKAESMLEAIEVFKAFKKVNMEHRKGTYTTLQPFSTKYEKAEHKGDYAAFLDVSEGEGFGPTVKLIFFADIGLQVVRVNIEVGKYNSGYKYRASIREVRDNRTKRILSRTYENNAALNGYADSVISYSSCDYGPIKKSAQKCYLFVADDGESCTEFGHVIGQLENIAAEFEGARS